MNFVRKSSVLFIVPLMLSLAVAFSAHSAEETDHSFARELSSSFRSAAENVLPAVVSIQAENTVDTTAESQQIPEMFRRFLPDGMFDQQQPQMAPRQNWQGSGVIISESGEVLTNNHVVKDADELNVTLDDGRQMTAEVIATDPLTDIALIQLSEEGKYPYAELGSSAEMQVGDWVLAIGNPFGLSQSVSEGIISARGRTSEDVPVGLNDNFKIKDYLQTTAAINPGNSGGPLINLDGKIIGINNAIQTAGMPGNLGIGFAIPSDMAQRVIDELKEFGRVRRGYIGVTLRSSDQFSDYYSQQYGIDIHHGAQVQEVMQGTPGAKAGLKPGDLIIEVDGTKVRDSGHLVKLVTDHSVGETINLTILRKGKEQEVKLTLAERPKEEQMAQMMQPDDEESSSKGSLTYMMLGMNIQTLNTQLASEFGYDPNMNGVVITEVTPGTSAARHDLQVGDVISELNDQPIESKEQFEKILSDVRKTMMEDEIDERALLLYVHRADSDFHPVFVAPTISAN